jgi:large subunit ribosomal protein L18
MDRALKRRTERLTRAARVRRKLSGTSERPRLCVRRSLKHISAQIVNDATGRSVVQVSSTAKVVADKVAAKGKMTKGEVAKLVGELLASKAKECGVQRVVFDRKGYPFHGRVKALADAARAGGLVF